MLERNARPHYPRYEVQLPISYRIEDPRMSGTGIGWTRDLSEDGACLELLQMLTPGTRFAFTLQSYRGPIHAQAVVAWTGSPGAEGRTLHGVEYLPFRPEAYTALQAILWTRSREPAALLRCPLDWPCRCSPKATPGEVLEGRTGALSRQGLLIHLPRLVPVGAEIALTLLDPHGEEIQVEGRILWREPDLRDRTQPALHHGVRLALPLGSGWEALRDLMAGRRRGAAASAVGGTQGRLMAP
jgi:hypothetical protein